MLSEADAIAQLEQQLTSHTGWLSRLQRGAGVDEDEISQTREALAALAQHGSGQEFAPKRGVLALLPLDDCIWPFMDRYPLEKQRQLQQLDLQLSEDIQSLYSGATLPIDENIVSDWWLWSADISVDDTLNDYESALGVIFEQMGGGQGMLIEMRTLHYAFHDGGIAVETTMRRLHRAFAVVQSHWAKKPDIPRCLILPFSSIKLCMFNGISHYHNQDGKQRVYALADELIAMVRECLMA